MPDPFRRLFQGLRGEAAAVDTAVNFALEQASGLENTQMFGHSWEREWERRSEFGDRGFALRQAGENSSACGVGEGGEGGVERSG